VKDPIWLFVIIVGAAFAGFVARLLSLAVGII